VLDGAVIGNFVEVKNATVGENTKACHLAYIGDATIGKNCNIGCGAIFVNYNGKIKNKTFVGDNCFIGSNCNIIAPVNIESNSFITAGTTITEDVKSGDFVIGRVRQQVKPNRAYKYLKNHD
jgi:bifunctional UDP-N-acetylglucosamine pyrophosphorylase/glucosamine-1-phosphate N-acetyltransferase